LIDQSPLAIVIENDGAVPVDFRERFFDKHSTSGNARGAGWGAYSAKLLAQAQGGSITLDVSDANNTTSVTVKLPALKVGT
jgi:sensor histidine kinase regulating citrate/malate metabolism